MILREAMNEMIRAADEEVSRLVNTARERTTAEHIAFAGALVKAGCEVCRKTAGLDAAIEMMESILADLRELS